MSYCLRFTDETEYESYKDTIKNIAAMVDVIGPIFKRIDEETLQQIPGFHVNVIGEIPDALVQFLVFPQQHTREFFGVPVQKSIEFVGEINGVIYVDINGVRYGFN